MINMFEDVTLLGALQAIIVGLIIGIIASVII
jgi:hypothetical protein